MAQPSNDHYYPHSPTNTTFQHPPLLSPHSHVPYPSRSALQQSPEPVWQHSSHHRYSYPSTTASDPSLRQAHDASYRPGSSDQRNHGYPFEPSQSLSRAQPAYSARAYNSSQYHPQHSPLIQPSFEYARADHYKPEMQDAYSERYDDGRRSDQRPPDRVPLIDRERSHSYSMPQHNRTQQPLTLPPIARPPSPRSPAAYGEQRERYPSRDEERLHMPPARPQLPRAKSSSYLLSRLLNPVPETFQVASPGLVHSRPSEPGYHQSPQRDESHNQPAHNPYYSSPSSGHEPYSSSRSPPPSVSGYPSDYRRRVPDDRVRYDDSYRGYPGFRRDYGPPPLPPQTRPQIEPMGSSQQDSSIQIYHHSQQNYHRQHHQEETVQRDQQLQNATYSNQGPQYPSQNVLTSPSVNSPAGSASSMSSSLRNEDAARVELRRRSSIAALVLPESQNQRHYVFMPEYEQKSTFTPPALHSPGYIAAGSTFPPPTLSDSASISSERAEQPTETIANDSTSTSKKAQASLYKARNVSEKKGELRKLGRRKNRRPVIRETYRPIAPAPSFSSSAMSDNAEVSLVDAAAIEAVLALRTPRLMHRQEGQAVEAPAPYAVDTVVDNGTRNFSATEPEMSAPTPSSSKPVKRKLPSERKKKDGIETVSEQANISATESTDVSDVRRRPGSIDAVMQSAPRAATGSSTRSSIVQSVENEHPTYDERSKDDRNATSSRSPGSTFADSHIVRGLRSPVASSSICQPLQEHPGQLKNASTSSMRIASVPPSTLPPATQLEERNELLAKASGTLIPTMQPESAQAGDEVSRDGVSDAPVVAGTQVAAEEISTTSAEDRDNVQHDRELPASRTSVTVPSPAVANVSSRKRDALQSRPSRPRSGKRIRMGPKSTSSPITIYSVSRKHSEDGGYTSYEDDGYSDDAGTYSKPRGQGPSDNEDDDENVDPRSGLKRQGSIKDSEPKSIAPHKARAPSDGNENESKLHTTKAKFEHNFSAEAAFKELLAAAKNLREAINLSAPPTPDDREPGDGKKKLDFTEVALHNGREYIAGLKTSKDKRELSRQPWLRSVIKGRAELSSKNDNHILRLRQWLKWWWTDIAARHSENQLYGWGKRTRISKAWQAAYDVSHSIVHARLRQCDRVYDLQSRCGWPALVLATMATPALGPTQRIRKSHLERGCDATQISQRDWLDFVQLAESRVDEIRAAVVEQCGYDGIRRILEKAAVTRPFALQNLPLFPPFLHSEDADTIVVMPRWSY